MSDIRTRLILGTSIGALAMIFVMAAGVDAFKTTTTMDSGMLLGHATVMAVNPDGSTSYAQGDNLIIDAGKLVGINQLFDPATSVAANTFNCIEMGTGGIAADAAAGAPTTPLGDRGQECTNGASCTALNVILAGTCSLTNTAGAATGDPAKSVMVVEFPALTGGDMPGGGSTVTINEVALQNLDGSGATNISSLGITDVGGVVGTVVTITYTMTLT